MTAPRALFALLCATAALSAPAAAGSTARYDVRFDATWSAVSHPGAYPANAHFSPLIGAAHAVPGQFWAPGGTATLGIESMAESGGTFFLLNEINTAIAGGTAGSAIFGVGINSPGATTSVVTVTDEFPLVTLVTMIAPSPDWFVGVDGVSLLVGGEWVDQLVVDLYAWDAGTDGGLTFTAGNQNTNPKQPIALITGGPFTGSTPLGTFTFTRRTSSLEYGCANPAGSFTADGLPLLGGSIDLELADPSGSMGLPSAVFWSAAIAPDPLFPCGTSFPDLGLAAPGTPGELLIAPAFLIRKAGNWNGSPVGLTLPIPSDPTLDGAKVYLQGFFIDGSARIGLTSGIELVLGS